MSARRPANSVTILRAAWRRRSLLARGDRTGEHSRRAVTRRAEVADSVQRGLGTRKPEDREKLDAWFGRLQRLIEASLRAPPDEPSSALLRATLSRSPPAMRRRPDDMRTRALSIPRTLTGVRSACAVPMISLRSAWKLPDSAKRASYPAAFQPTMNCRTSPRTRRGPHPDLDEWPPLGRRADNLHRSRWRATDSARRAPATSGLGGRKT
jgi:hypothetical protein